MNGKDGTDPNSNHSVATADLFGLAAARQREAKRRRKMLSSELECECDSATLRARARATRIPVGHLAAWQKDYLAQGEAGLLPDWNDFDEALLAVALERYHQLGEFADAEIVTAENIHALAERVGKSEATALRWLRSYRVGGLRALAPQKNGKPRPKQAVRDVAALDDDVLQTVYERLNKLGSLPHKERVTEAEVCEQAEKAKVHPRTLWTWLKAYREGGLAGLAPMQRADHGTHRNLSERMRSIIAGLWLRPGEQALSNVHADACERARLLDEPEPSVWQVRAIGKNIPKPVVLLARGKKKAFQNRYGFTIRMVFNGIIYQIDHTPVDVLVRDLRSPNHRTRSGEVRPWLTLVVDAQSRLVMAAIFGYDRPDRFTVAAAIRDALLISEQKPYGGIPDELWVDHGKELLSEHVQQICQSLGIKLYPCLPHRPQTKGIVERFFGTLNSRLWSKLEGYVGSNTTERPDNVKAELTLSKLAGEFWAFIAKYHAEVHSETEAVPLDFWNEHCLAEPADPRQLDILLMESKTCRVSKMGISFKARTYWHTSLATLVGEDVLVRAGPSYDAPDEIEVFRDGQWVCTAFALDSAARESVTRREIAAAQKRQRDEIKRQIAEARQAVADADQEIAARNQVEAAQGESPPPAPAEPPKASTSSPRTGKRKKPNLLDRITR